MVWRCALAHPEPGEDSFNGWAMRGFIGVQGTVKDDGREVVADGASRPMLLASRH